MTSTAMPNDAIEEPPEFLNYSPSDVAAMGAERGLPPEQIAQGVMKHRSNVEGYGRTAAKEKAGYWRGVVTLDNDTENALEGVRRAAERKAVETVLPEERDRQELVYQLETSGFDPDAVEERLRPALQAVDRVGKNPVFQMPQRIYGGAVKVGDTTLARYAMREAGDGRMDVSLQLDDDSTELVRIPKATDEEVRAEVVKRNNAAVKLGAEAQEIYDSLPLPEAGDAFTQAKMRSVNAKRQEAEQARNSSVALQRGGVVQLMGERVRDELKRPEWRERVGKYAGWEEFAKGTMDATLDAGALVARAAGDEGLLRRFAEAQDTLDTAVPGSTRRRLEGGLWNDSVSGAQRAVGQMAPHLVGGVVTRGATIAAGAEKELAKQSAGRLGVAGAGMSASASGNAYLTTQRLIDEAEANGDTAKAERLRLGRDLHALLTGVVEGAVERIGAAQAFHVGRGAGKVLGSLAGEAVEEPITGIVQRGVVDPLTIDQHPDVTGPVAQEALTGLLAAGPIVVGGKVVEKLTPAPGASGGAASGPAPAAPNAGGPNVGPAAAAAASASTAGAGGVSPLGDIAGRAGSTAPGPDGPAGTAAATTKANNQPQPQAEGADSAASAQSAQTMPAQQQTAEPVQPAAEQQGPPNNKGRAKMAEKILTSQGVDPDVAAVVAAEMDKQLGADLDVEQFRAEVLTGFEKVGGEMPMDPYVETPETYMGSGATRAEAERMAQQAKAANQAARDAVKTRNRHRFGVGEFAGAQETGKGMTNLRGGQRGRAGSTTLPGIAADLIIDAAVALAQGVADFAVWAADMVKRFGEEVRQHLQKAWDEAKKLLPTDAAKNVMMGRRAKALAVQVSQVGAVQNPFHRRGTPFRVDNLGLRQFLTGSPLAPEFVPLLTRTQNEKRALDQAAAQLGRDLQTSIAAVADRTGMPVEQVNQHVNAVLDGTAGAMAVLSAADPTLAERARRARNMIDDLSLAVAQTLPTGPLRTAIVGNLGTWLRRSYAAFDQASGWKYDALVKAAANNQPIAGRSAAQILAAARAFLQAETPTATPAEIEADMRDLMDRTTWEMALVGPGGVRKNIGSMMRRQSIPAELRALMGEETHPLKRFIGSAGFQAQFIARHHGQLAMRAAGLAGGLFSTSRGGVYTQEIPGDGPRWSGLVGLWTTPQLWLALQRSQGVLVNGTDMGGKLVSLLKTLGNEAKLNRVAMNPDSWLVNILGNWASALQSGDVFAGRFIARLTEAAGVLHGGRPKPGVMVNAAAEALQDAQRDMIARLTSLGVLGSSLTLADLEASLPRHLLQWMALDQTVNRTVGAAKGAVIGQGLGRGFGAPGRVVGGVVGAAAGAAAGGQRIQQWQQQLANWVMTGPDALTRTTGFLTNYETALASGMAANDAMPWAAARTLNTYPNYAALPGPMRELSRLGIMGSFIAFQYEVYRNFGWNAAYAWQEIGSGNPALVQRGLQRLAGIGVIAAMAAGGLAWLLGAAGAAGGDDERNKKFRKWFGAPWEKDAVLAFRKFDADGVSYYNTSYLLPQITITELLRAAKEGESPANSAARVSKRLIEQFVAGSVHLQPILAALANQNRTGKPITYEQGMAGAAERVDYVSEIVLEPGFSAKLEKLVYALRGAEKKGQTYSVDQEFRRLVGLREVTRTWDDLALGVYRDFAKRNSDIRSQANREIGLNRPGATKRAIEDANKELAKLRSDAGQFELDAQSLGVPGGTLLRNKKEASVTVIRDVALAIDGKRIVSLGR